eukprot:scaffold30241_cov28-Tisochrysis_lutea.AAC.9
MARFVLPTPGLPVRVTSRTSFCRLRPSMSTSSRRLEWGQRIAIYRFTGREAVKKHHFVRVVRHIRAAKASKSRAAHPTKP